MSSSVLVTGASRGIGLALAIEFARHGWTVFAGARDPACATLREATKDFPSILPLSIDLLDEGSIRAAADFVARSSPALDVLVNNAAIFPGEGDERFEDVDPAWFTEAFETNVTGTARVTRAFLPLLRKAAQPRLVNISSGAASISTKEDHDYYPYSVSKAALNMLTRAQAAEFRPHGLVVVAISPGWVKTEMGGPNAPSSPEESAGSLCRTISRLALEDSGKFLGRDGSSDGYAW